MLILFFLFQKYRYDCKSHRTASLLSSTYYPVRICVAMASSRREMMSSYRLDRNDQLPWQGIYRKLAAQLLRFSEITKKGSDIKYWLQRVF